MIMKLYDLTLGPKKWYVRYASMASAAFYEYGIYICLTICARHMIYTSNVFTKLPD